MGKVKIIIWTIILLWLAAFVISRFVDVPDFEDKIALIPVHGVIATEDVGSIFERNFASSDSILEFLDKAVKDDSVKGIMLEINSPGGTVVASKEIADKIKTIKKPVVAYIR